ncbi:hypothetical protein P3T76_003771 [Phytophthora citrophthora]|uniref:Pentacotripeptide-repeat region of PRORP domain-containing protein n=1 Tax=Phytophthora citrophthora TaxID=4793 RepID=A0AAD9GW03_9STRA|nr:hypothetical protein P3T76_003771 [Phytophthora citrophthora]
MWTRVARSSASVARYASTARYTRPHTLLRVPVAAPDVHYLTPAGRAFISSSNDRYGSRVNVVKVRGMTLHELVQRPWIELQEYYGPVEMSKVCQSLHSVWKELSSHPEGFAQVAPEIVEDFYEAARCCRLPKLQRDVFSYMEKHYPLRLSFEMYGQMFTNLMATKDWRTMRAIFERAKSKYDPEQGLAPPEIVYRFGISAAIALEDYEGMKMLLREMETRKVKPSIEIVSRVMVAQAMKGDVKTVLIAAEKLDPQDDRKWHEADVNRIITSLGIAGAPDKAFDFYRRSQLRLSPNTFMKLMLVCRGNARPKHAQAILANRRRFGMKLLPSQYSTLLETIEELDIAGAPANEMALILDEMRDNGVPFNDKVHGLIARNQKHLHGTPFMLTPLVTGKNDAHAQEVGIQPRTKAADAPLLRELLDARQMIEAAAIVDCYVVPVSDDMKPSDGHEGTHFPDEEATIVPPWLADMAVEAYSQNQDTDKVRSLLRGFRCVRGNFKHAISRIVGLYGGKGRMRDGGMAYEAFLAMQFQGFPIFRVRDALTRFKQHQDTDGTMLLLGQISKQIAQALAETKCSVEKHEDLMRVLEKSGALNFDPVRTVRDVMGIFLALKRLDMVVAALDQLESDGVPVRSVDYEKIFSSMTKTTDQGDDVYAAEDLMSMWEDMVSRSVVPSKAALRLVIPVLCGNVDMNDDDRWKRRKLAVIEGYHVAAKDRFDNYVLPIGCFSTLLEAAAKVGCIEDVNAIHADAVKSLEMAMNKRHHSPGDRSTIRKTWNAIKTKATAEANTRPSHTSSVA